MESARTPNASRTRARTHPRAGRIHSHSHRHIHRQNSGEARIHRHLGERASAMDGRSAAIIRTKFEYAPGASRLHCTVCGKYGYPGGSWADDCKQGHPYVCRLGCGRRFSSLIGRSAHERPRRCDHHHEVR